MRSGWAALIAAIVMGCGGGSRSLETTRLFTEDPSKPDREAAARALIEASASHDPARVASVLDADLVYAGLWFPDSQCRRDFAVTGRIPAASIPALAACLAPLSLVSSSRLHAFPNVAIFTYEPGIEIEVMFDLESRKVRWIGYAARRGTAVLPTLSADAFAALRLDPQPVALDAPTLQALNDEAEQSYKGAPGPRQFSAWFRICLDATGTTSSARAYEASSRRARDAFAAIIATWRFKPAILDGQPTPVCSLVHLVDRAEPSAIERAPMPLPDDHADAVIVPIWDLPKQIEGTRLLTPAGYELASMRKQHISQIGAMVTFCVASDGRVDWQQTTRPSGWALYDARVTEGVSAWRFEPPATPLCSKAVFVIRMR